MLAFASMTNTMTPSNLRKKSHLGTIQENIKANREEDSVETKCINGNVGVEIVGVDLNDLSNQVVSDIMNLFRDNVALLFRGQNLAPASQVAFSELFGPVNPHPLKTRASVDGFPQVLILENKPGRPGAPNDYWHSDISHMAAPPSATVLQSLVIPEGRGDTMICNMVRAYEQLSDRVRDMIADLRALHSGMATYQRSLGNSDARRIDATEVKPPSSHPVVRTPAGTNQKALFVNPHFTIGIEDMSKEESDWLLGHLNDIATKPENVYRHQWKPGDVLVWDNRRTMHYAVRDYTEDMPRKLHRCTAGGEIPV